MEYNDSSGSGGTIIKNIEITFNQRNIISDKHLNDIPLYNNSTRNLLISSVHVSSSSLRDDVILAGVALFASDY